MDLEGHYVRNQYQKPYAEYTHMCFTMRILDCKTRRLYHDSKVWPWGWNQLSLHSCHASKEYEIKLLLDWMTQMFSITGYEALCVSGSVPGCHHLEPLSESSSMAQIRNRETSQRCKRGLHSQGHDSRSVDRHDRWQWLYGRTWQWVNEGPGEGWVAADAASYRGRAINKEYNLRRYSSI